MLAGIFALVSVLMAIGLLRLLKPLPSDNKVLWRLAIVLLTVVSVSSASGQTMQVVVTLMVIYGGLIMAINLIEKNEAQHEETTEEGIDA